MSTRKPFSAVIKMSALNGLSFEQDTVALDVSFSDLTLETWAWAKVADSFLHPEEGIQYFLNIVWARLYPAKMKRELDLCSSAKQSLLDENAWSYYSNLVNPLRQIFRRRAFHAVVLDEFNTFRFLPALLRNPFSLTVLGPIKNHDPRIYSVDELCKSLSTIPFKNKVTPESELTGQLRTFKASRALEGFDSLTSNQSAAWSLAASPPDFLSENFFAQMSSPSSMIARREGSLLEHAIGLCSMLLGKEENAYVAIGNVRKRCYIWVIIVMAKVEADQLEKKNRMAYTEQDEYDMNQDAKYTYGSPESTESFNVNDFERFSKTESIRGLNSGLVIFHYDTATGKRFQYVPGKKFPFDRISTIFNHRNIWYNIQHTDLISQ